MTDWDTPAAFTRPRDDDAEATVLGSIMYRPAMIDELLEDGFDPADFQNEQHPWIWQAVDDLRSEIPGVIGFGAVHDRLTAWHASRRMAFLPPEQVRLSQIFGMAQPSADYYAQRVTQVAARNRLIDTGMRALQLGQSPAFDRATDIADVQGKLDRVVRDESISKPAHARESTAGALERAVTPPSAEATVPTGLADLDSLTGGWRPGQLIVVAARPGVGKTTAALGFARAAAVKAGLPTLMVTMEMSRDELTEITLAAEGRVPLQHIRQGTATPNDVANLRKAKDIVDVAPLRFDDTAAVTLGHLRHLVRTLTRTEGLRLLIVDYLQLMQAPRAESRQVAVAELARGLKLIAKEFQLPVIALAQLNRGPEQRADKRPLLSDLRESGAVEQDADIVVLLHREDAHDRESARAGEVDLIVAKHRGGTTATITVAGQLHYGRFVDMAGEIYNPFAHRAEQEGAS